MSYQVEEITKFRSGIDLSLDPILTASDAFVNLRNGYVHRGVLRSRTGLKPFADGTQASNRKVSRVADEITDETAASGDGGTDYNFTLANDEVERVDVVINAPTEALTVTLSYDPENRTTSATGDTGGGTNNINYATGEINVSFSGAIGGGNDINVTYNYHPGLDIVGLDEYVTTGGTRELVIFDLDFPYTYNGANDDFDRISFAGGVGPFTGSPQNYFTFQNWRLNSRGAVPAAAGALTLSDVMFMTNDVDPPFVYDGTNVDLVSNMPEFRQPSLGALQRALHVLVYGERLIWLRPRIGNQEFEQAVLFGPINDTSALALDYQDASAGLLSAATNSRMTGWHWLHDMLIVFFETDVYVLELTDDAFNPYRWTKLESERGSEAPHGSVGFFGRVEAPGKLGIIGTDGRRTGRVDDKIPDFTKDEIDPNRFEHIYGEEMEKDSQFWWSYVNEEDFDVTTTNKILTKNFEEENFSIYDLPLSVFNKTIQGNNTAWDNLPDVFGGTEDLPLVDDNGDPITTIHPVASVIWDQWGKEEERYKTIAGDHEGFIWTLNKAYNDNTVAISPKLNGDSAGSAITLGTTTTIELEYHNFFVGDIVEFSEINGTTELNGLRADVLTVPDRSSITVNIDSSNFTAWTSGGFVTKLIDFQAEFSPFNPLRSEGQTIQLGKMDFLVKSNTGEYAIDFFENREGDAWTEPSDTYSFSSGDDASFDRWFSIFVDNKADFHRWRIRQLQSNEQIVIKSVRVFYKASGQSNI